jgi:hypothetical protein
MLSDWQVNKHRAPEPYSDGLYGKMSSLESSSSSANQETDRLSANMETQDKFDQFCIQVDALLIYLRVMF